MTPFCSQTQSVGIAKRVIGAERHCTFDQFVSATFPTDSKSLKGTFFAQDQSSSKVAK